MMGSLLFLLPACLGSDDGPMTAYAKSRRALNEGRPEAGLVCAEQGLDRAPEDPTGLLRLGQAEALFALGRLEDAAVATERALASGLPEELGAALLSRIHGVAGRIAASRSAAIQSGTLDGLLWATALGDAPSARAVRPLADGFDEEAVRVQLALAWFSRSQGRPSRARRMAERAGHRARRLGLEAVARSARALELGAESPWRLVFETGTLSEAVGNPLFESGRLDGSVFLGGQARVQGQGQLGGVRGRAGLLVEGRGEVAQADGPSLGGWSLLGEAGLDFPIAGDPSGAILHVDLRFQTRWLSNVDRPLGTLLELGPTLRIPLFRNWRVAVGGRGVRVDVGDRFTAPDDAAVPENRDVIGQRAFVAVEHEGDRAQGEIAAFFANDQADGAAFDARGGGLATRVQVQASGAWTLSLGGHVALRDFGPASPAAVAGRGETVLEVRTAAFAAAEARLGKGFGLRFEQWLVRIEPTGADDVTRVHTRLGLEKSW
ncbi:MAG: hypothetical protein AAGD10_18490 [Myxococcota bacterium]